MSGSPSGARLAVHEPSGELDRVDDARIARAAAEVAADRLADLLLAEVGARVLGQEREDRHQETGRAESALESVAAAKRLLDRVELSVGRGERLDGANLGPVALGREGEAGARRAAVDRDGAAPADPVLAAHMRPREARLVTDEVGQQEPRLDLP